MESYPLPQTLGNVSISVTVGGSPYVAYPEYVSAGQINAVLSSSTPIGAGTVIVTYNGTPSAAFPITVVATSFGTFSWNSAGTGPGIFTNAVTNVLASPFTTVKPGDYVTIWGTGLGAATGNEASGPPTQVNACVSVGLPRDRVGSQPTGPSDLRGTLGIHGGRSDRLHRAQNSAQGCYVQVAVETGNSSGSTVSLNKGRLENTGMPHPNQPGIFNRFYASPQPKRLRQNLLKSVFLKHFIKQNYISVRRFLK